MDLEHRYQDSWQVPARCCVCGEPVTDGKPYVATATLDKQFKMTGGASAEITTKMASISFPRCAKCVRATSRSDYAQAIAGIVGLLFGIAGITLGTQQGGTWAWGCATGLLMWIGVSWGVLKLAEWLLERSFDDDMRRRAKLSATPVTIKKVGTGTFMPELRFGFSSDEYGEAFAEANP